MKKILMCILLISLSFSSELNFKNRNNNLKPKKILITKNKDKENNDKKILILKKAKKLMGKKYVWGAKVGDYNNFDCSSFVKTLYKEAGINLPRVSKEQSKIGNKIPLDELEIGDLIFFHTLGNYVSHVGIYIGNNEFIHASSKANKTIVSKLSGYYRQKAVFGTRLGI
ncbi:C40 family peptidase [Streptobacillus moniliformis]|uniref:C40 family peptidase n=1 Tax=Streptobacillus moniliformis TaxID=34105 RepID=UPI0007E4375E|nr:C40 family peptidase [Streptobacillus moniliformis]QXW66296.1 C40 family peptidase [Streptobacillus moniliformis]